MSIHPLVYENFESSALILLLLWSKLNNRNSCLWLWVQMSFVSGSWKWLQFCDGLFSETPWIIVVSNLSVHIFIVHSCPFSIVLWVGVQQS